MKSKQNQILTERKVRTILDRMAIEIIESNYQSSELVLIGIEGQGSVMASLLKSEIEKFTDKIKLHIAELKISKASPHLEDISLSVDPESLTEKPLVLVDDVMNTGRTQAYALSFLMNCKPKKVETAVLVNRSHPSFPISVSFSGIALSTTMDNHIEVRLESEIGAYLY